MNALEAMLLRKGRHRDTAKLSQKLEQKSNMTETVVPSVQK